MALNLIKKILGKKKKRKAKPKQASQKKASRKKTTPKKKLKQKTKLKKSFKKNKEKEIGVITHYFGKISVGIIKLKTGLKVGDKIEVRGTKKSFQQIVKSMQIEHKSVLSASKGAQVGIKVKESTRPKNKVFKV